MDENHYLRSTFYTNEHITIVIIVVVVVVVVTRLVREEETTIKTESGGWSGRGTMQHQEQWRMLRMEKKKRRARRCAISSLDLYLYVSAFIKFI